MKSRNIIVNVEIIRSISIFSEGRAAIWQILNIFGPNLFNICPLVALPSENIDIDLIFYTVIIMFMNLTSFYLVCDGIFSVDSYDPHIFLIMFWKLMTGWWIWYFINDRRYCKIFIIQLIKILPILIIGWWILYNTFCHW